MWKVYALLAAVTVIAGLTPTAAKMATDEFPPLTIPVVRFGSAGILLLLTGRLLGPRRGVARSQWSLLILIGVLCVPVNQIGYLYGAKKASATHAGIAYALVPVLVFWISLFMRRAELSVRLGVASLLAFVGAAVIVLSTGRITAGAAGASADFAVGDVLLLSAALSWSLFAVLSQPLVRALGAVRTLSLVFLIGTAWQIPLAAADWLWFELSTFEVSQVTWRGVAGFAFITLVTAYLNYLLWYVVTARYDITRSSVITNAHFLVTVLIEAFFFGQVLSWWVVVGSVVLLAGIVLVSSRKGLIDDGG